MLEMEVEAEAEAAGGCQRQWRTVQHLCRQRQAIPPPCCWAPSPTPPRRALAVLWWCRGRVGADAQQHGQVPVRYLAAAPWAQLMSWVAVCVTISYNGLV